MKFKSSILIIVHVVLGLVMVFISNNYAVVGLERDAERIGRWFDDFVFSHVIVPANFKHEGESKGKFTRDLFLAIDFKLYRFEDIFDLKLYGPDGHIKRTSKNAHLDKQVEADPLPASVLEELMPVKSKKIQFINNVSLLQAFFSRELAERDFVMHWYVPYEVGESSQRIGYKEFSRDVTQQFEALFYFQRVMLLTLVVSFLVLLFVPRMFVPRM